MSSIPEQMPYLRPSGEVFFPLASNAHALVTGGSLASVRARIKIASLLYGRVLLEVGQLSIQAGPHGSQTWRHQTRPDAPAPWQTPKDRGRGQASPLSLSMARGRIGWLDSLVSAASDRGGFCIRCRAPTPVWQTSGRLDKWQERVSTSQP